MQALAYNGLRYAEIQFIRNLKKSLKDCASYANGSNKMQTEIIDKLFLELSQITKAKTEREMNLEQAIKEIAAASSWESQAVYAELALAIIEDRAPEQFAIEWLDSL